MKTADIIVIIVLSLMVWVFFAVTSAPLDGEFTLGLVAVCTGLVLAFRWVRNRFKKEAQ